MRCIVRFNFEDDKAGIEISTTLTQLVLLTDDEMAELRTLPLTTTDIQLLNKVDLIRKVQGRLNADLLEQVESGDKFGSEMDTLFRK